KNRVAGGVEHHAPDIAGPGLAEGGTVGGPCHNRVSRPCRNRVSVGLHRVSTRLQLENQAAGPCAGVQSAVCSQGKTQYLAFVAFVEQVDFAVRRYLEDLSFISRSDK